MKEFLINFVVGAAIMLVLFLLTLFPALLKVILAIIITYLAGTLVVLVYKYIKDE